MSTEPTATSNPLSERIGDASAVLVLAPSLDTHDDEACLDLLTVTDPAQEDILSVTITQSAEDRIQLWDTHADALPAQLSIITTGEFTRSGSAMTSSSPDPASLQHSPDSLRIETIADPSDLTTLGITISMILSEWAESETQTVACFHSITPLLQYADLQDVFRFLHILLGRFEMAGAVAHFHLDSEAHDHQTIRTLTQLFDVVIERDDDGEWGVTQR